MTYKDPDKQREANKEAMRRHRARKQGITITDSCVYCGKELEFAVPKCCYSCRRPQERR